MADDEVGPSPRRASARTGARLRTGTLDQLEWAPRSLDETLPPDHSARAIHAVIGKLDLEDFYGKARARLGEVGAPATDPKILLALWVYATSEGISSARELGELCHHHDAYRWLCRGVPVEYRTLSSFRERSGKLFDELITKMLALLMQHELVDLHRIAQDGTRIRASAGAASFRRGQTLEQLMLEARAHLELVMKEGHDPKLGAVRRAARKRAAEDRVTRLEAALAQLPEVIATKQRSGSKDSTPRVSTTDPDARVMKMGDGGFRPALDVQFGTTTDKARVIVGVAVTNSGSDMGQSTPMLHQVERRTGTRPTELLVDGGFAKHVAVDEAAALDVSLFGPIPKPRDERIDRFAPKPDDSPAVAEWRARMATDGAKEIYKLRAAVAETVNADAKGKRGLDQLPLRGLVKAHTLVCLFALTYNILRFLTLTAA